MSGDKTQTGIPIRMCDECGKRHPITRPHCRVCKQAHLARGVCEKREQA